MPVIYCEINILFANFENNFGSNNPVILSEGSESNNVLFLFFI